MSPAAAKRALETGRRLGEQPEVAAAALAGDLSLEQATAISDAVAANPAKAGELIDTAKRSSLPELNEAVAKVKAACGDQEQRRWERHAKRSLLNSTRPCWPGGPLSRLCRLCRPRHRAPILACSPSWTPPTLTRSAPL